MSEVTGALMHYDSTKPPSHKRRTLSTISREELAELAEKHTTDQIATILGFGETYIRSILVKHGITFRTAANPRGRPRIPDDQKAKPKSRYKPRVKPLAKPVEAKPAKPSACAYESPLDRAKRLGYID